MNCIERLFKRRPMTDAKADEVRVLTERSAATLRRVDDLVCLARIDAEMAAASAKQRWPR